MARPVAQTGTSVRAITSHQTRRRCVRARAANAAQVETTELGKSGLHVSAVGVGAWSWGDRSGYWGFNKTYQEQDNAGAYQAMLDRGLSFIDTAEVYGFGKSEELIRKFAANAGPAAPRPVIATKFAPLPWRFTAPSVVAACRQSLQRLGQDKVGLYMIHWPGFLTQAFSNDEFVRGLAECRRLGLCDAIGVSNFSAARLRDAQRLLAPEGLTIAANQVQYSLLYRQPERNGVRAACEELGITLTAYSPMAQGLLAGKYTPATGGPKGPRGAIFSQQRLAEVQPLIELMRDIGQGHGGKTPAQVAVNWCICKGALPLPGAKTASQVDSIAGAAGWRLGADEVAALDAETDRIPQAVGAPFENF